MVAFAEAMAHRANVQTLTTEAVDVIVRQWRTFDLSDAAAAARDLGELLPIVTDTYGDGVALLATDWYDALRDDYVPRGAPRYRARPSDLTNREHVRALTGWGTAPLRWDEPDELLALSRIAGGLQRRLVNRGRDTIIENTRRDPVKTGYRRATAPGACAFCAMLAGNTYTSEDSATGVIALGSSRRLGDKYHDYCRCEAVPVFGDDDLERPSHYAPWEAAYELAVSRVGNRSDTSAILAEMRRILGTY